MEHVRAFFFDYASEADTYREILYRMHISGEARDSECSNTECCQSFDEFSGTTTRDGDIKILFEMTSKVVYVPLRTAPVGLGDDNEYFFL